MEVKWKNYLVVCAEFIQKKPQEAPSEAQERPRGPQVDSKRRPGRPEEVSKGFEEHFESKKYMLKKLLKCYKGQQNRRSGALWEGTWGALGGTWSALGCAWSLERAGVLDWTRVIGGLRAPERSVDPWEGSA